MGPPNAKKALLPSVDSGANANNARKRAKRRSVGGKVGVARKPGLPPLPQRARGGGASTATPSRGGANVSVKSSLRRGRRRSDLMSSADRRAIGAAVTSAQPVRTPNRNPPARVNLIQEEEATNGAAANIRVAVRVRPENDREEGYRSVVDIVDDRMLVFDPKDGGDEFFFHGKLQTRRDLNKRERRDHKFAFDAVFGPESDNQDVFEKTTRDLIDVVFKGYNCSVFVYGATGAGKTFTMLGSDSNPGLTFRTVLELYERIEQTKDEVDCEVVVSYLEVYNETVVDLMNPGRQLNIREDGNNGVQVPGLTMHKPDGAEHLLKFLRFGNANRTQHPTDVNAESSRSHAVFQVYLKLRPKSSGLSADVKVAKLSMIDLAGSERGTVAMARGAVRLREGANINKSLLALGNCINSLAEGSKYIPYRNSKLTRLLKDSIGGNCRTVMISNISPSSLSFEDTYNTLKYADRAKRIKVKLKKNIHSVDFHVAQYSKIVETLKAEIRELKEKNQHLQTENEQLKAAQEKASEEVLDETLEQTPEETVENNTPGNNLDQEDDLTVDSNNQEVIETPGASSSQKRKLELENEEIKAKLAKYEAQEDVKQENLDEINPDLLDKLERHKEIMRAKRSSESKVKAFLLKEEFGKRICQRSNLLLIDGVAKNLKLPKYISLLRKKMKKEQKKLAKLSSLLKDSERNMIQAVKNEREMSFVESESNLLSAVQSTLSMTELFRVSWEEHERTESILRKCLPQIKDKHLLLANQFGVNSEVTKHQEYKDLIATVQCTNVQFNESPDVVEFNEEGENELNEHLIAEGVQDRNKIFKEITGARTMNSGGLGPVFSAVVNFGEDLPTILVTEEDTSSNVEGDVSSKDLSSNDVSVSSSTISNLAMPSSSAIVEPNLNETYDTTTESTFVVDEEDKSEDSNVNSTFVLEECSPKFSTWHPATPPKKMSPGRVDESSSNRIQGKENEESDSGKRPVVDLTKSPLKIIN